MSSVLVSLLHSLQFMVRSRASLHLEIIALRHQLAVVNRSRRPRLRLTSADRVLWAWLSQAWSGWRSAVHIVRPDTVIAWHRRGFRLFWTWKSAELSARTFCTFRRELSSLRRTVFGRRTPVMFEGSIVAPLRNGKSFDAVRCQGRDP